ncbi:DMT family transporter [Pseudothioclava arenosa]|uniref:EamA family transporter n=1 Tax=Pseudothioclava arenosa TaxID=1795308 RepID=A0A2A4CV55_9RHOB|nr:DMT family transporter [Pseudothioclava arenosa]PCD78019.1 EamA family transporter [Pseudothioclava arenosa]
MSDTARGILFKIGSVALFVAMSAILKATAGEVPPGEQVFFRSLFAIPITLVWLASRGDLRHGLKVASPMGHVWRGLIGTCAMGLMFAGIGILPLPEATAIGYAAPLLVVIFAAMFLGEEVRAFRLTSVALGLLGVLIILSPRLSGVGDSRAAFGAMVALMGAVFAALAQIFIRKLTKTETTSAIVFWFSCTATVLSFATLPFGWVMPPLWAIALLVLAGLIGGVAQILLTSAYRAADASIVAPFEYASMLMALAVGYLVFDEVPTLVMLGGAALVIAAGVLIVWRERQLGIERARQRRAMSPPG